MLGTLTKLSEDKFRKRVELYALRGDKLLCGIYGADKSIGTFGGGIEKGQTEVDAGKAEYKEEGGFLVDNIEVLPLKPFKESWKFPALNAYDKEKQEKYDGNETTYLVGDLGKRVSKPGDDHIHHMRNIGFRTLDQAIKQQAKAILESDKGSYVRVNNRMKVLQILKEKQDSKVDKVASK